MWVDPFSRRLLKGAGFVPTENGRGPIVLMYHSITSANSGSFTEWDVPVKNFREQLKLLESEGWHNTCVRELLRFDSLPPRTVVITFDDGYLNNFENGFQILCETGMKATWFIVTGDIGKISSWSGQYEPTRTMLSRKELRKMAEVGMEIAAHTRTHPRLPELSAQEVWNEVSNSKKELEDILGQSVVSFAYPYGDFNEDSVAAVKKAGYQIACTARPGWLGSDKNLLRVRRVAVFAHDNLSSFARKLAFADNEVGWRKMSIYAAGRMKSRFFRKKNGRYL